MAIVKSTNKEQSNATKSDVMLTTTDNPYNPFTRFDEWYAYDIHKGYNTCSYLARIAKSSSELSEVDQAAAREQAIDEIVAMNVFGKYIKVTRESFESRKTATTS